MGINKSIAEILSVVMLIFLFIVIINFFQEQTDNPVSNEILARGKQSMKILLLPLSIAVEFIEFLTQEEITILQDCINSVGMDYAKALGAEGLQDCNNTNNNCTAYMIKRFVNITEGWGNGLKDCVNPFQ